MNYQCPAEFNVPTTLLDCKGYTKKLQESTDPLKYKMDLRPGPLCMMTGRPFQGLMMAQRRPPPNLLGVEQYLKSEPIREQERDYVIDNVRNAKPPRMPKPLSNKLIVPECKELPGYERTKIRKGEQPHFSARMERNGRKYYEYSRPGRDTRAEVKEAWKKKTAKDVANSNIYGVAKYDKRPLVPGTNPDCVGEMQCMHVYGPDSIRTGQVLDPSKSVSEITATGDGGMSTLPARWESGDNGNAGWNAAGVVNGNQGPTFTSVPGASETRRVAATINPDVPYTKQMVEQQRKAGCKVQFYDYKPVACQV